MAFVVLAVDLDQDKILDDQVPGVQRVSVAFVFLTMKHDQRRSNYKNNISSNSWLSNYPPT